MNSSFLKRVLQILLCDADFARIGEKIHPVSWISMCTSVIFLNLYDLKMRKETTFPLIAYAIPGDLTPPVAVLKQDAFLKRLLGKPSDAEVG